MFKSIEEIRVDVSVEGKAFNVDTGHYLSPYPDRYGNLIIYKKLNGRRRGFSLARLMAIAFVPNPENKPCVAFKDGNKNNILAGNLEWSNHKEFPTPTNIRKRKRAVPILELRDQAVVILKAAGMSYDDIGELFKITQARACLIHKNKANV